MRLASRFVIACLLATTSLAACDSQTPPSPPEGAPRVVTDPGAPLGQLPTDVSPLHYTIDLKILPEEKGYDGTVAIELDLKTAKREIYLHGQDLDVTQMIARRAGGEEVKGVYTQVHDSGVAKLTFEEELPAGKVTVSMPFKTTFNPEPDALTSMTDSGDKYAWTQFEANSARRAFPSFDEPRFKTPFDITLTAKEADAVVTNTLPVKEEKLEGGLKKITFATTEPLPTYLIAFAVGPYDVTEGPTVPAFKGRPPVPLRGLTVKGKGDRVIYALRHTPPLMRWLEDYFAAPFPYPKLDIIAPPNFLAGGMENAGAITYTERGILLDDASSIRQKRYFMLLHAHEVAHQWFGDLVTPKWWNDIWLNEAFASWMGNKASLAVWPEGEFARETIHDALDVMDTDSLSSARAIRQPIETNDDIANAFDGLTYDKGGAVLQMFESYLGEDAFREGVRTHMRRFAHGTADVRDFMESLAQGSGKPEVVPAFETFLNQPGVPLVRVKSTCSDRDLIVELSQTPFGAPNVEDKRTWSIPVCMRDVAKGRPLACTMLSERTATTTLPGQCGATLLPNTNGAGYYRFSMARDEWQKLAAATARMSPAEHMALLHSLRAAFRTGDTDAATYVATLKTVAQNAPWDVLQTIQQFLTEMRGNLLTRADVPLFEQKTRAWITPALAKVGLEPRRGEPAAITLARATLAEIMVMVGRDPSTLSAMAGRGAAHLRAVAQSQPNPGTPPELVPVSLWAAVFTGGEPVARDALAAIKASSEAEFRIAAITALTAARDPKAIAVIEEFVASGSLRVRETRTYLRELFADAERRAGAWAWMRKDFQRLTDPVPKEGRARFIGLTGQLCTDSAHAEVEWFFKPMVADMIGAPRTFANALETIDRCVAWRKAKGADLAAAWRALP